MKKIILISVIVLFGIGLKAQQNMVSQIFTEPWLTTDTINFEPLLPSEWHYSEWQIKWGDDNTITEFQQRVNLQGIVQQRYRRTKYFTRKEYSTFDETMKRIKRRK